MWFGFMWVYESDWVYSVDYVHKMVNVQIGSFKTNSFCVLDSSVWQTCGGPIIDNRDWLSTGIDS